jgi:hypothetical protein
MSLFVLTLAAIVLLAGAELVRQWWTGALEMEGGE